MPILQILYYIFLMPLQMLFEAVYNIAYNFIKNPGITLVIFSLAINLLVLHLYKRADALQEKERKAEARLSKGVQHIKKTFHGDEQMMMLQTYYRQNDYKPSYALRGAASLLLEIPFFIVAYRFLSTLNMLQGCHFGPITDLGKPDGLLTIFGITINLLPIIMTAVNLISSYIFTKGYPIKSKIQLYAMAAFFLIFLYNSPSGLVFYWTLNNIFSLVKTIFYKLKNTRIIIANLIAAFGVWAITFGFTKGMEKSVKWAICFAVVGLISIFFACIYIHIISCQREGLNGREHTGNTKIFLAESLFLALLTGFVIPSAVIAASPQEFIVPGSLENPLLYIGMSCCISVGMFVIWLGVFYSLMDKTIRYYIEQAFWIICGMCVANYMLFGRDLGLISDMLQYEKGMSFTYKQQLLNLAVLFGIAVLMWLFYSKLKKRVFDVLVIATLALCTMGAFNAVKIQRSISEVNISEDVSDKPLHSLSRNGKNVIVLMLDRAMGGYIPYIMNERPELKKQFDGFTYYSNTISFAPSTSQGSPALFGGYEYTTAEINKRDKEQLVSKHNEALKLMPVIFNENGYKVTVCQPPIANYKWVPDLSIYDDYPDIKAYNVIGNYSKEDANRIIEGNKRNFFALGITKVAPIFAQNALYQDGRYNCSTQVGTVKGMTQTVTDTLHANGLSAIFLNNYNVLKQLPNIITTTDDSKNTFLIMVNEITHRDCLLQLPDYTPSEVVDNTAYADQLKSGYTVNKHTLKMENVEQIKQYQVFMAGMIKLGEWFDYLREEGVYNNTRIIIVADHGRSMGQIKEAVIDIGNEKTFDTEAVRPLLMVKDFNQTGFSTSDEFMTNADTPTLAFEDLIENPVNPFTNKKVDNSEKTAHDQYILTGSKQDISENADNTFNPGTWYAVHGDTWNPDNWKLLAENSVLPNEIN